VTLGPPDARVTVFTFKEGLLSKMAHDLRIAVGRFEIAFEPEAVRATFDPTSLTVVSPVRDGRDAPGLLSDRDLRSIEDTIRRDVLESRRFHSIRFTGAATSHGDDARTVEGTITLHGIDRPLRVDLHRNAGRWLSRVELDQRDFGITPYKAMLGTLRIQPRVLVELSLPALP
jgi:polyisoprenoid-binding protein YceI